MNDDTSFEDFPESEPTATEQGTPAPPSTHGVDGGIPWGLIAFLILSIFFAIFAVQNTQDVELEFFGWSGDFPLIMIIVGVFATGVVLDEILGTFLRRRRRRRRAEKAELAEYRKRG